MLINSGAQIDTPNKHKQTPLWIAAKMNREETLSLLLDAGADWRIKNKTGTTAEKQAQSHKNDKCFVLLRSVREKEELIQALPLALNVNADLRHKGKI